jgi:hypothetical protein
MTAILFGDPSARRWNGTGKSRLSSAARENRQRERDAAERAAIEACDESIVTCKTCGGWLRLSYMLWSSEREKREFYQDIGQLVADGHTHKVMKFAEFRESGIIDKMCECSGKDKSVNHATIQETA